MPNGPVFPAFLRLEYQRSGSAKSLFLADVAELAGDAEKRFAQMSDRIGSLIGNSLSSFSSGQFKLDLDMSSARQAAAEVNFAAERVKALRDAAINLATATKDTSDETRHFITALKTQADEAARAKQTLDAQVTTYSRLQGEIDKTISKNERLAQSYRDTFLEQAKAANFAYQSQQAVNAGFAPGLDRQPKSAKTSASVFEDMGYKPNVDLRSGVEKLLAGSASIDKAALSFTTLEQVMGRVATKGAEVSTAIQQAADQSAMAAEEEARRVAAALAEQEQARKRAASAAQGYAAAADALRAQLDPSFAAQQRYNQALDNADELLKANAISEREHAAAVALARQNLAASWDVLTSKEQVNTEGKRKGTTETQNVINGVRAQRVAFTQLGQQLQDVTVQAQMGTSATTIFVQQVPQMAFALSGLEGNTNKFYSKIGSVATFLAGQWGAAIFAATAVLGPYVASLFQAGDAADDAKGKTYDFSHGLDVLTLSANQTVSAMQQLQTEMRNAIAVQGDYLRSKALIAGQSLSDIDNRLAGNQAELNRMNKGGLLGAIFTPGGEGAIGFELRRRQLKEQIALDNEARQVALQAASDSTIAVAQSRALESLDKRTAATGRYNRAVAELNEKLRQSVQDPISAQLSGNFISQDEYEKRFRALSAKKDAEIEAAKPGRKGPDAAKEAKRLQDFGDKAAESIQRINERFNEQPRLVDAAAQATRQLDAIIKDLSERRPTGFQDMIAEAEAAKRVVEESLAKPFADMTRDAERRVQIQSLILSGREAEANALRDIWQLEDRIGDIGDARRSQIRATAEAEQRVNEILRTRQEIQSAYLQATQQVRSQLEALLSGESVNFGRIFRQLRARILVENMFGDVFRNMDKAIRKSTGVDQAIDELRAQTGRASDVMSQFADAVGTITGKLAGAGAGAGVTGTGSVAGIGASIIGSSGFKSGIESIFYDAVANTSAQFGAANDNGEIVVTARKKAVDISSSALLMTPSEWAAMLSRNIGGGIAQELKPLLGQKLAGTIGAVLGGAAGGYATGGVPGGILGALKEIKGLPEGMTAAFGKALKGAQTGTMVSGLGNALGINMNETGAQIGGAIGKFIPIPGGDIIGSIAGGLIGGLIAGIPRGRATVTNSSVQASGNRGSIVDGLNSQGGSIQQGISAVAKQLGATVGQYAVGIGSYKGKYYQVSSNANDPYLGGAQYSAKSSAAVYDGTDAAAALRAAVGVAIQQGAIVGIRASTQTLLKAGKDIEQQVDKALKFEGAFRTLKGYTDPVGAALDDLNKRFSELKDIFAEAGASATEYADLEKLYGIERTKAVKDAMQQVSGSLQSLLDDLKVNNTAFSLRDRESMARAAYDPLAARVAAGDTTAFDDFATASRTLLDVSRQLYGSQAGFFDLNSEITALTQSALDRQLAIANAATSADSPFTKTTPTSDNASVAAAIQNQTDILAAGQKAMNDNLAAIGMMLSASRANGTLPIAAGNW